jgi:hypothetical protein
MFKWVDRKTYIQRTSFLAYDNFVKANDFCLNFENLKPIVDVNSTIFHFLEKYCYDVEGMSKRQLVKVTKDIFIECYELARAKKNETAKEYFSKLI